MDQWPDDGMVRTLPVMTLLGIEDLLIFFQRGLVATLQAFQKGYGAYLSTRLLLGLCEAGFIPASLYTISMFYKKEETSKRFSIFFLGNLTGVATTVRLSEHCFDNDQRQSTDCYTGSDQLWNVSRLKIEISNLPTDTS